MSDQIPQINQQDDDLSVKDLEGVAGGAADNTKVCNTGDCTVTVNNC